jgi:hypothetical protein
MLFPGNEQQQKSVSCARLEIFSIGGFALHDRDGDLVHQVVDLLLKKFQNLLRDEQVGLVQILEQDSYTNDRTTGLVYE